MKENEFLDGISHIESDVVERFVLMDNRLKENADTFKSKRLWLRVGAIAACAALIISAIVVVPMLRENGGDMTPPDETDVFPNGSPNYNIPSISTITSGGTITGKQELMYGNDKVQSGGIGGSESGNIETEMVSPGFYIRTVVQANVIEVLPDSYYLISSGTCYLVARLSIVDAIRGEGLPQEIYLRFSYYSSDIFDGYDTFIFSLEQIGVENYMMVNDSRREVTYFPNMFEVATVSDLGYGSVIAFNDGQVDDGFWDRANRYQFVANDIKNRLSNHVDRSYPVGHDSTLEEAKANIIEHKHGYASDYPCDYVTTENIFLSDEAKQIQAYLAPSESNVFQQRVTLTHDGRVVATYQRVINGFVTEESITFNQNPGGNGSVSRTGEGYTAEDLSKIPDIGGVLAEMDLSQLQPPHMQIVEGMQFKYASARGFYRKVDGRVYGIIRIMWSYTYPYPIESNGHVQDDCYYLYDEDGNGSVVEREELTELIGKDGFIAQFKYNHHIELLEKIEKETAKS